MVARLIYPLSFPPNEVHFSFAGYFPSPPLLRGFLWPALDLRSISPVLFPSFCTYMFPFPPKLPSIAIEKVLSLFSLSCFPPDFLSYNAHHSHCFTFPPGQFSPFLTASELSVPTTQSPFRCDPPLASQLNPSFPSVFFVIQGHPSLFLRLLVYFFLDEYWPLHL